MNNKMIQSAPAGTTIRCPKVSGLHVRVSTTGRRVWYLYYRTKGGRERRPSIGPYPDITISQARAIARSLLLQVASGEDPSGANLAQRDAPRVSVLIDKYLQEVASRRKSHREITRLLRSHVEPRLGATRVCDVSHADMTALHHALRSTPYQANRVIAFSSRMFNQAERWGWRPRGDNPCYGVERFPERKRTRYMSAGEAATIATLLDQHKDSHPYHVAFIYLLIMTGARVSEIGGAKWSQLHGATLRLEDSKTGARTVYLPAAVLDVLDTLPRDSGPICGMQSPRKFWEYLRVEAGCPDLRLHDLRHSFASAALAAGLSLAQIGELLGHKNTQTTHRYAHLLEELGTSAVNATADVIQQRMTRQTNKEGSG